MTETQQKHVEQMWAIKMDHLNGEHFFSPSHCPNECRCTFATRQLARQRIITRKSQLRQIDGNPRVVRVEIREL